MLLRGFDDFSFFVVLLSRKRKAVYDRTFHKWNKPSLTADKPGRMILSVGTPSPKQVCTNVYRLPHKRRKGLCITPNQWFRLMMQDPFLLCLCHRGAFTGFLWIFLFAVPLSRKRKAVYDRLPMNGTSRPHGRQTGKNDLSARPNEFGQTDKPYFLAGGLPVSCFRQCSFSF